MQCEKCGRTLGRFADGTMCRECKNGRPPRQETPVVAARACEECGREIGRRTKSGKCIFCRRKASRKKNVKTCACGARLGINNTSGRCLRCYLDSRAHTEKRNAFWRQVNVGLLTGEQSYGRDS